MKRERDVFQIIVPEEIQVAMKSGHLRSCRPGRIARSGTNPKTIGDFASAGEQKQVPFGPSGLRLYAADLEYLARVQAGRAATKTTTEDQ